VNGRAEVGLPLLLLGVTVVLAALAPVLSPDHVVIIAPLEGHQVLAPTAAVALVSVVVLAGATALARRWARLTRSRRPAALAVGQAHALAWAGLVILVWPLALSEETWAIPQLGMGAWVLGTVTGWATTRHRPIAVTHPAQQPPHPGDAVAWTGHARLSVDVAAPLLVFLLLVAAPPFVTTFASDIGPGIALPAMALLVLLIYLGQLRALWVSVTIGVNGIRIRTGPVGRVLHCRWDEITRVEVIDEELPADSLLWAQRFERRYVLRPGPALHIHQPHHPIITVTVDNAHQAAAIATRHLVEQARHLN
jgi:hypothetical protein